MNIVHCHCLDAIKKLRQVVGPHMWMPLDTHHLPQHCCRPSGSDLLLIRSGEFGGQVDSSSYLLNSLGHSWTVFIVQQCAPLSCWGSHCNQGVLLPWWIVTSETFFVHASSGIQIIIARTNGFQQHIALWQEDQCFSLQPSLIKNTLASINEL